MEELEKELRTLNRLTGLKLCMEESASPQDLAIVKKLILAYREKYSAPNVLSGILTGQYTYKELLDNLATLNLKKDSHYSLYLLYLSTGIDENIREILHHLFPGRQRDHLIPLDREHLALLHTGEEGVDKLLFDTISAEAMADVYVAYSDHFSDLTTLPGIYHTLRQNLQITLLFYPDKKRIPPRTLGIGELIFSLPKGLCEKFLRDYVGDILLGEDMDSIQTAMAFFRHNLSIAETARHLHMHRNTLVYRLEQIEKKYHLDIKNFEGAMIFHIAIMITYYMKADNK